jgi:cobalt-zinc-cadmium efflux system protein
MHNHDHHDHHLQVNNKFLWGILLNTVFVCVEFFYGWKVNSISLKADAWHNLSDVLGLIISWFAFFMASKSPTKTYTYGYSKGTILASLANCIILFWAVGEMFSDAYFRIKTPTKIDTEIVIWIAGLGIVINTLTALLFFKEKELNNRAAFLHMAADALVSLAVLVGGVVINYGGPSWIDPMIGALIGIVILYGTWNLFCKTLRLSLDGVPYEISIEEVYAKIEQVDGVIEVKNLHVWAISTTRNACTLEVKIDDYSNLSFIKNIIKNELKHYRIQHTTIETY